MPDVTREYFEEFEQLVGQAIEQLDQVAARLDQLEARVAALEVKPKPAKRKTRLREDWEPSAYAATFARLNWPDVSQNIELEQFKNHHISRGTTMADWDRAWYTWLGNTRRFMPRSGNIHRRTNDDKINDLMAMDIECRE